MNRHRLRALRADRSGAKDAPRFPLRRGPSNRPGVARIDAAVPFLLRLRPPPSSTHAIVVVVSDLPAPRRRALRAPGELLVLRDTPVLPLPPSLYAVVVARLRPPLVVDVLVAPVTGLRAGQAGWEAGRFWQVTGLSTGLGRARGRPDRYYRAVSR